jgi:nicotinate dehydrogenase subunit A
LTKIQINGEWKTVEVVKQTPLLYVLRQQLDCKSVRFGCGSGHCGECKVGLNGQAVQSCDTPLGAADRQTVETVDHLMMSKMGSVVHQSFIDVQAAQCGYCINGILVSLVLLFRQNLSPERDQIIRVLDRHLCRCGTHSRILKAVDLAKQRLADLKLLEEGCFDGTP